MAAKEASGVGMRRRASCGGGVGGAAGGALSFSGVLHHFKTIQAISGTSPATCLVSPGLGARSWALT